MLRSSAVLLSGGLAGALATTQVVPNATAAEAGLTVTGDELTIRNGELAAVWLDIAVEWAYAVPSGERPAAVEVDVLVGTAPDAMTVVDSTSGSEVFLESNGTETFAVDLLDAGVLSADALVPSKGGETADTTVHVGTEMRLVDESGLVIAADSQTDTATLSIEKSEYNPDEYGGIAGAGELTIEVE